MNDLDPVIPNAIRLVGGDGSPYSCKMRAYLRYRRIDFVWTPQWMLTSTHSSTFDRFPDLKAKVIPVMVRPDGTYANDSTPLVLELEATHHAKKTVPLAAGDAFLAALLEDFADEWMTKVMFEARFNTPSDAKFGATWQHWQGPPAHVRDAPDAAARREAAALIDWSCEKFASRQVTRRRLVTGQDWGMLERSLRDVCGILESLHRDEGCSFLFGQRPTTADFGLFGQLRQLAADPLPSRIMHEYPIAWAWVWKVDEMGGYFPPPDDGRNGHLTRAGRALLRVASQTHLPFLRANYGSIQRGEKEVSVAVYSGDFTLTQAAFKYQATYCWPKLQEQFRSLRGDDLSFVRGVLRETGCLDFFEEGSGAQAKL